MCQEYNAFYQILFFQMSGNSQRSFQFQEGQAFENNIMLEQSQSINELQETQNLSKQPEITKENHSSLSYRPDIDGLRAIAISVVLVFHAWPQSLLCGGFVGVDVFFVISGYLITQILVKENLKNKFSYYNFYNRRVKRIYPALIIMLLFVIFMGMNYSDIKHFLMLTKTMAASTIFGANIQVLTYNQGYFDPSVKMNPLLHLWSLGVQEQFYIFWPFIITLMITKFKQHSFKLLVLFTVFSFIINVVVFGVSEKFDFYFPFCRFWQMAIGGLLAVKKIEIQNKKIADALSIVGLIGILLATLVISEENRYPGFWALFPTLASASIIQSGPQSYVNKYILSNKLAIFIGKISYSLYLWHWPLLVFSRLMYPQGSLSIFSKPWLIVLIAFIMACFSYYYVENPLRIKKQKSVFVALLIFMTLIGVFCFFVYNNPKLVRQNDFSQEEKEVEINWDLNQEEEEEQQEQKNQKTGQSTEYKQPLIQDKNTPPIKDEGQIKTATKTKNKKDDLSIKQKKPMRNGIKTDKDDQKIKDKKPVTNKTKFDQDIVKTQQKKPSANITKFMDSTKEKTKKKKQKTPYQVYRQQIRPTQDDYVQLNGKRIPNFSKNRNRLPVTLEKIKLVQTAQSVDYIPLQKKINKDSKYYRQKIPYRLKYNVANEGQDKLVLIVGDSHAHFTSFRFGQLYRRAKKQGRLNTLPTIVQLSLPQSHFTPNEKQMTDFIQEFVKDFKPSRILFVYFWETYQRDYSTQKRIYKHQKFFQNIKPLIQYTKKCIQQGINVTISSFQKWVHLYNPRVMFDINGIIQSKVQPYFANRTIYQNMFYSPLHQTYLRSQMQKLGVKVIDYDSHKCWEGICQVILPSGYPANIDPNHWERQVAALWLTSVDYLIQPFQS